MKSAKKNAKEAKLWATHDLARKRIDVSWDQELMPQKWTLSEEIAIITENAKSVFSNALAERKLI